MGGVQVLRARREGRRLEFTTPREVASEVVYRSFATREEAEA